MAFLNKLGEFLGLALSALAICVLHSCGQEQLEPFGRVQEGEPVSVKLDLGVARQGDGTGTFGLDLSPTGGTASTKAVDDPTPASDTRIQDLWVIQYSSATDDAVLAGIPQYISDYPSFIESGGEITLLSSEDTCQVIFVANTLKSDLFLSLAQGSTISTVKQMLLSSNSQAGFFAALEPEAAQADAVFPDDADYLMPLNGILKTIVSRSSILRCELKHTLAKIEFNLTNSTGLTDVPVGIKSVELRNVPTTSRYITDCELPDIFPATGSFSVMNYDPILWENGKSLGDNSRRFTFYVPANIRGITDNAIPAVKRRSAPGGSTLVFVDAYYLEGRDTSLISYSFYLGENLTSDFNLRPNNVYSYDIEIKSKGDGVVDGRVDDWGEVDFSRKERANCYILNPPEVDDFTRVFKIPVDRVNVFWGGVGYEDSKNYVINANTEWQADILWCDFDTTGVFHMVSPSGTGPTATINVGLTNGLAGENKGGNAVIGVRIKTGEDTFTPILWSWHLWITDYRPDEAGMLTREDGKYVYEVTGGAVHRYNNDFFNTGIYKDKFIMDRNIGDYADHNYEISGRGVLYYQFGRKDPFPSGNAIWINVNGTLVNKAWSTSTYTESAGSTVVSPDGSMSNVPYSVNNPLVFLTRNGTWTMHDKYNPSPYDSKIRWHDPKVLDDNGKSIFDPSPPGWKLPKNGTWTNFNHQTSDAYDMFVWNATDKGSYYYPNGVSDQSTGRIYYPASGLRSGSSAGFTDRTSHGYYWTCSPSSASNANYLVFSSVSAYMSASVRARGLPVRPVQE